jgi:hypothetical protein
MSESTDRSITGLKVMVLGTQMALFGRFILQSVLVMLLGGALTVIGLFVR